ncbi:UDP-N-acetylglucosamine--peptide N-acetylglucosaminyltransferase 110 kDa subunit [Geobacter sp. OR-1]|uniref:tetratricopeptide repeat protein n=1 Tax=Geobacter sp. OR-1 TaxID=1266765 RepID=UPI0005425D63|nr:tetratricopeptide repeat protein [Geobacter sp. OR-1]GAM11685.1 UDP-N-acetylglucosamine--peptide N-acetylglucosaminyltransferase 110 kDa subunit [Geobacter sp. OR-1]
MRTVLLVLLIAFGCSACALSEANRKKAAYHFQMGESYLREQNITSALVELTEAEKYMPDDPQLLNFLGLVYFRKGKYEIAEQKYLKALEIKPSFSEARNHLAVNYMEMQRWDDAITHLKAVTDDIFYQGQESAGINLGLAYLGKGDLEKALTAMKAAVSAYPRNHQARVALGRVYFAQNRLELAAEEFRRGIDLAKGYVNAHYYLGLALMKATDNSRAKDEFREVVRLAPDSDLGRQAREYLDLLR